MSLAALQRIRAAPAPPPAQRRLPPQAIPRRVAARGSRDDTETSGDEEDSDIDEEALDAEARSGEAESGTDELDAEHTPTVSAASSPPAAVPLLAVQRMQRTISISRGRAPVDRGALAAPRRAAKRVEVPTPPPPPARAPAAPRGAPDSTLGPWLSTVTASTLSDLSLFLALPPPAAAGDTPAQALVAVPAGARVAMSNAHRVMDDAGNVWAFVKWVDASAAVFSGWARIIDGASKAASLGSFSV